MQVVAVMELPSERGRERAPNRGLAGARHSHNDHDHGIVRRISSFYVPMAQVNIAAGPHKSASAFGSLLPLYVVIFFGFIG